MVKKYFNKKESMKDKYLSNRKKLWNANTNEKIDKDVYDEMIVDCEDLILRSECLLKLQEVITIPIFITTFGVIISLFKTNVIKGIILFAVVSIIEVLIISFLYYKTYENKYYCRKNVELIKDYLNKLKKN